MILFIPFLIAFLTGGLIFGAIYRKDPWQDALGILVSFWFGVAGCSCVALFSILITGYYDPLKVIIMTFILLLFSCLLCCWRQGSLFLCFQGLRFTFWLRLALLVLMAWFLMNGLKRHNFYGDWDAWSLWNYRARYLVLSDSHWRDLFAFGTQGKHPWLLPYWTVFGWAWLGGQSYAFSFLSAQIFCLIVLATVFFSIMYLTKNENVSFFAAVWLLSIPYFLTHSISQYADVLTASLILLNMMLLFRLYQQKTQGDAVTLGIMLGIMSFSKDEGIISALLIVAFLALLLRKVKNLYFPFFLGLGLALIPTLLVKWWMCRAPSGVNTMSFLNILDGERWVYIFQYFLGVLSKSIYGGALIIPFGLLVSRFLKPLDRRDQVMVGFLMIFIVLFFILYVLVSGNLHWRLLATGERLVYQILPLAIVFLFYRLFGAFPK